MNGQDGTNGMDEWDDEVDLNEHRSKTDDSEAIDFFPPNYRIGRTKYMFVTGGVMSGVGKGVFSASLGHLLKHYGFTVSQIKMDGYLNQDAGTINPYRHGEVFVLLGDGNYQMHPMELVTAMQELACGAAVGVFGRQVTEGIFGVEFTAFTAAPAAGHVAAAAHRFDRFLAYNTANPIGQYSCPNRSKRILKFYHTV